MNTLHIAEIRGTIQAVNPGYPIAVHGFERQGYLFYPNPDGYSVRRYVAEGADPDKGLFDLALAQAEMTDIQLARNAPYRIKWELVSEEEFVARRKKAAEEAKAKADEEAERRRMQSAAEAEAASATARAAELSVGLPAETAEVRSQKSEASENSKPKAQRARPRALSSLPV